LDGELLLFKLFLFFNHPLLTVYENQYTIRLKRAELDLNITRQPDLDRNIPTPVPVVPKIIMSFKNTGISHFAICRLAIVNSPFADSPYEPVRHTTSAHARCSPAGLGLRSRRLV